MIPQAIRAILIAVALASAIPAQAQDNEWYVSGSAIFFNDDPYRAISEGFAGAQFNGGRNLTEHLSLEGTLGYVSLSSDGCFNPGDCFPDQDQLDFSANLLAYFNRDSVVAPYLLVGVGYLSVDVDEDPIYTRDSGDSAATASLGLGLKWRLGQSNYSIRAEHRVRTAFDDNDLTDQLTTIGLQYDFGGRLRDPGVPESNADTDGDGVLDIWDACDNTAAGVDVTERGCEIRDMARDDDDDRVNNDVDQCPNTPLGVPVDRRGCSLDSDMDGVATSADRCPASRSGADVNIYGCEVDNDNDGVVDHRDDCLFTKSGARVDIKGCEISDIINLPGVNFESGVDLLLPGTEYLLQTAADTLNQHPDLQIEVAGHTDDVGNADLNQGLSMRRAKTVRDYLIQFGVDESRLTFKGYGEAQPITDNATADGRAVNRRVELRLSNF